MSMSDETHKLIGKLAERHGVAIVAATWLRLMKEGLLVKPIPAESRNIWDAALNVKTSDGEINSILYFHNSFLEVFTIDRDDDPLIIDSRISEDREYLASKIKDVVDLRVTLTLGIIKNDCKDMGKTIEKIYNDNPRMFERIRMMRIDAKEE